MVPFFDVVSEAHPGFDLAGAKWGRAFCGRALRRMLAAQKPLCAYPSEELPTSLTLNGMCSPHSRSATCRQADDRSHSWWAGGASREGQYCEKPLRPQGVEQLLCRNPPVMPGQNLLSDCSDARWQAGRRQPLAAKCQRSAGNDSSSPSAVSRPPCPARSNTVMIAPAKKC